MGKHDRFGENHLRNQNVSLLFLVLPAGLLVIATGCTGSTKMTELSDAQEPRKQGWVRMIGVAEAGGPLKEVYTKMRSGSGARPAVYSTPTGDAANIVKCHSLDPEGLRLAFGMSSAVHWGPKSLPWVQREMLNTVTSGANNCFY